MIIKYYTGTNNLNGQLPTEVGELTSVKVMSLYDNQIHGILPENIHKMNNLQLLYLHSNKIRGDVGFMCSLEIQNFRADCFGLEANVQCVCCNVCCVDDENGANQCYTQ
mmetsp:Transcript_29564/g.39334  ORF Transcript_29564/g.39334 Transcript_29564/m.39334 type:complete len:109 (+) Transcript_29564:172-498(+)